MVVTSEASNLVISSSKKYPYPLPAKEGNGNSEGKGVPKVGNFRGGGGWLQRFFPWGLSKIG